MPGFSFAAEQEARADFTDIINSYAPHGHLESLSNSRDLLLLAHRFALSIGQIAAESKGRPEHQRIFLEEMASDSVHLLHVLMVGDARAAHFYMRSVVENFWRHIYYKDHAIEYAWLHQRSGYFITIDALRDYCKYLPISAGSLRNRVANLSNYFSSLSRTVHSTTAPGLTLRANIASIKLNGRDVRGIKTMLGNLSKDVVLLVSSVESSLVDSMSGSRRAYLLAFLDARRKRERQEALTA